MPITQSVNKSRGIASGNKPATFSALCRLNISILHYLPCLRWFYKNRDVSYGNTFRVWKWFSLFIAVLLLKKNNILKTRLEIVFTVDWKVTSKGHLERFVFSGVEVYRTSARVKLYASNAVQNFVLKKAQYFVQKASKPMGGFRILWLSNVILLLQWISLIISIKS